MAKRRRFRVGARRAKGSLGTFAGVFTPSVLTILGIILFLRLGYVVGNAGLRDALLIICLANLISVLTTVSLAAIATNLNVKGGGDYYLISRTLGVEFGGAIGLVLFLAQSVSIAFYTIGFGEAVSSILPPGSGATPRLIAGLAVAFLFVFAWLGADWATRLQYMIMAILAAALVSFFVGGIPQWDSASVAQNWAGQEGGPAFWLLFAIFFPAVTGFTQGVSMSGDLKDPGKSIPMGTFAAVGLSIVVYFGAALVFAGTLPLAELSRDYGAMKRVAVNGRLIDAGVIAATLSSAMASFLGAPRILQSIATDRVFPFLHAFAHGVGRANNPRRAVLVAAAIATVSIMLGNLNLIAPVVSMFFLISYGLLNYATFFEARTSSPSFRPRFKWFDARLSLLGFLACLGAMLAINPTAAAIAVAVLFAVYQYLRRTAGPARWADSSYAYHFQRVRDHLYAMAGEVTHPRDWRPQLLAFSNDPAKREHILRFGSWIEGGSGMTTAIAILEGEAARERGSAAEAEAKLRADIKERGLQAFARVVTVRDFLEGSLTLFQSYGVGPLRANTLLLNWLDHFPDPSAKERSPRFGQYLRAAHRLGCNVIAFYAEEDQWHLLQTVPSNRRRIDVWWWEDESSRLTLLLAYLMTRHDEWREATIRVLAVYHGKRPKKAHERLEKTLDEVRIEAQVEIVADADAETIVRRSGDAATVFIPLRLEGSRPVGPFGGNLEKLLSGLPLVALTLAAEDIDLAAEPEEGVFEQIAEAQDTLAEAKKDAHAADKETVKATGAVEAAKERLTALEAKKSKPDSETKAEVKEAVKEAKQTARKADKRAAEAQAKVDEATSELDGLVKGGGTDAKADDQSEK